VIPHNLGVRLWPEWAEREARKPPPNFDPRFWGYFWRVQGFETVALVGGLTILAVVLLIVLLYQLFVG
jgi:hypothetical protein